MVDIIFCPTVVSTGTNFVLHFFHSNPNIPLRIKLSRMPEEWSGVILVHEHFEMCSDKKIIEDLAARSHVVTPIRDPLASLVKAYNFTNYNHHKHKRIQAFLDVISLGEQCEVKYIPVDLLAREPLIKKIEALVNISGKYMTEEMCVKWAAEWPVHNSAKMHYTRVLYESGNVDDIRNIIPKEAWKMLVNAEPILRPFLEKLGYRKLSWWSD